MLLLPLVVRLRSAPYKVAYCTRLQRAYDVWTRYVRLAMTSCLLYDPFIFTRSLWGKVLPLGSSLESTPVLTSLTCPSHLHCPLAPRPSLKLSRVTCLPMLSDRVGLKRERKDMDPERSKGPLHPFSKCPSEGQTVKSSCGARHVLPFLETSSKRVMKRLGGIPSAKAASQAGSVKYSGLAHKTTLNSSDLNSPPSRSPP